MKYHPDKNVGDEVASSAKFRDVQAAYDQITNPSEGASMTLDDLFEKMFGGMPVARKVQTVFASISIATFCDGGHVKVRYGRSGDCPQCAGAKGRVSPCRTCNGTRYHSWAMGPGLNMRTICPACEGAGTEVLEACHVCEGSGVTVSEGATQIKVPAGCAHEATLRARVAEDADLRVRILHDFPSHITARGADLIWKERVTLKEVLVGFKRTLRLHAGSGVTLRCAGAMDPSAPFRTKLAVGAGHLVVVWVVEWDMDPIRRVHGRLVAAFQTRGRVPHPKSASGSDGCPKAPSRRTRSCDRTTSPRES
jgi:DnaJ-class molecular chaperone